MSTNTFRSPLDQNIRIGSALIAIAAIATMVTAQIVGLRTVGATVSIVATHTKRPTPPHVCKCAGCPGGANCCCRAAGYCVN